MNNRNINRNIIMNVLQSIHRLSEIDFLINEIKDTVELSIII